MQYTADWGEAELTWFNDDGSKVVRVNDVTGTSAFDHFVNVYAVDGVLSEQTLVGIDGGITETVWDTLGSEAWQLQQTVLTADGIVVTDATLYADGTVALVIGEAAAGAATGAKSLAVDGGALVLASAGTLSAGATVVSGLEAGEALTFLRNGIVMLGTTVFVGAAAFAGSMYIMSTPTGGGEVITPLLADVRVRQNGEEVAQVQVLSADGVWLNAGVSVVSKGGVLEFDVAALVAAIGEDKVSSILQSASIGDNGGPPIEDEGEGGSITPPTDPIQPGGGPDPETLAQYALLLTPLAEKLAPYGAGMIDKMAGAISELFPSGGWEGQLDRLIDLALDPDKGFKPNVLELASAVRLELELGMSVTRAPAGIGQDVIDALGHSWDFIGSAGDSVANFNMDQFMTRLKEKIQIHAADGIAVDIANFSAQNALIIQDYISQLPPSIKSHVLVIGK